MGKSKTPKQSTKPYKDYLNYLNTVDTGNVDSVLGNLTNYAANASNQLGNMGDYSFNVNGSDEARQRAENATYQAAVDKLSPLFERQTQDLESSLINKGLPVGSEAYQRAMNDLQDNQNEALNQAAYQSILAGQDAFSRSLADEISAGSYGNTAQQQYINQLYSALQGSPSEYEKQQNIYAAGTAKSAVDYENAKASAKGGLGGAITGAIQGGITGLVTTGNPWGAAAGAAAGAYSGYNSNPYASGNSGNSWTSLLNSVANYKQATGGK